jgi:signal peptidase II
MCLGQEIHVSGNWFILHFTENNGMAFGMEFAGESGKLFLTFFRIVAACVIGYYIFRLTRQKAHPGLIICISLIFAGAFGNIIDSVSYGLLFDESTYFHPAALLPPDGGYSSLFHGKVVDMLYFPIIRGEMPSWLPFMKSKEFIFFRPVFNIADSSITVGVTALILFQRRFFRKHIEENHAPEEQAIS